jgi:hypothetical protein
MGGFDDFASFNLSFPGLLGGVSETSLFHQSLNFRIELTGGYP